MGFHYVFIYIYVNFKLIWCYVKNVQVCLKVCVIRDQMKCLCLKKHKGPFHKCENCEKSNKREN